jgi:hypothetical protein
MGKIWNEGRKMMERSVVACRIGDLFAMYNLDIVKCCFILWCKLLVNMIKFDEY